MTAQTNVSRQPLVVTPATDHVLLRRALLVDAVISGVTGLVMVLFPNQIETFIGGDQPQILMLIGIGFMVFAAFVFTTARETPINRTKAWIVVELNIVYVIASFMALAANIFDLNTIGNVLTLVLALGVADFAFFEWLGLRRGQTRQ